MNDHTIGTLGANIYTLHFPMYQIIQRRGQCGEGLSIPQVHGEAISRLGLAS